MLEIVILLLCVDKLMMNSDAEQCPGRLLLQAAIYNNVDLMESLLEGPELEHINAVDSFGRTALYTSVTNNSYECCQLLLLAGGIQFMMMMMVTMMMMI